MVPTPRMNTCLVLETSVSGTNRLASQDVSGGPGHPVKRTCFKATCFKTNSGGNTRNVNPVRVCSGFCRRTNKHKANQKNTIMKNKILPILTVFEIFLLSVFWCLLLACSGVQARIEPICFKTKFQNIKILSSFLGGRKTFVIQDINSHARKELERGVTWKIGSPRLKMCPDPRQNGRFLTPGAPRPQWVITGWGISPSSRTGLFWAH